MKTRKKTGIGNKMRISATYLLRKFAKQLSDETKALLKAPDVQVYTRRGMDYAIFTPTAMRVVVLK